MTHDMPDSLWLDICHTSTMIVETNMDDEPAQQYHNTAALAAKIEGLRVGPLDTPEPVPEHEIYKHGHDTALDAVLELIKEEK